MMTTRKYRKAANARWSRSRMSLTASQAQSIWMAQRYRIRDIRKHASDADAEAVELICKMAACSSIPDAAKVVRRWGWPSRRQVVDFAAAVRTQARGLLR